MCLLLFYFRFHSTLMPWNSYCCSAADDAAAADLGLHTNSQRKLPVSHFIVASSKTFSLLQSSLSLSLSLFLSLYLSFSLSLYLSFSLSISISSLVFCFIFSIFKRANRGIFLFVFSVFSFKWYNFLNRLMLKMSVQYLATGFELTTSLLWVSTQYYHYLCYPSTQY